MLSSADLFSLALLATGGLYASMLAYFNGLIGTKRSATKIMWNSEPLLWILTLLLTFSVAFRLIEPGLGQGPGVWYLIGTGNLMVIYIYLVVELARHDLPAAGYWTVAALSTSAVLYLVVGIVMAMQSQTLDLDLYKDALATFLVAMTHVLMLILFFNLLRSLRSSLMKIWLADPKSIERLTAGGIAASTTGEVSNPDAALSDINLEPGTSAESCTLQPNSCLIVDFGIRRIEDHGFRSDLRVVSDKAEQVIEVKVSNDMHDWVECEREQKILTDWDVPYFDSPWRYVRICNTSDQAIDISEVYDLD